MCYKKVVNDLVGVSQTTHTTHDSQHIVVYSEYLNHICSGICSGANAFEGEGCIVDTGHVAGTGWLMLLRLKGKGIHIDKLTDIRDTLVVLIGLHQLEIHGFPLGKALMAVKGNLSGIVGGHISADFRLSFLLDPNKFLDGMVEVEFDLTVGGFITCEL